MASQHPYAPWRRLIMVPCWIIQTLFPGFTFGIAAASIALIMRNDFDDEDDDFDIRTSLAIGWVDTVICILCIFLTIGEMVLMLRRKLKPLVFLIMNIFKSTSWTVVFIIGFWNRFRVSKVTTPNIISLVVNIVLLLAFYTPLIHGSLIFHRNRRAALYVPVNPKHTSYPSINEPFPEAFPAAYKSLITIEQTTDLEASDHSTGHPRRLSYNPTRDTRFGSYKHTRRSFSDPYIGESMVASPTEASFSTRSRSTTLNLPIPQVVVHDHDVILEMNRRINEME